MSEGNGNDMHAVTCPVPVEVRTDTQTNREKYRDDVSAPGQTCEYPVFLRLGGDQIMVSKLPVSRKSEGRGGDRTGAP